MRLCLFLSTLGTEVEFMSKLTPSCDGVIWPKMSLKTWGAKISPWTEETEKFISGGTLDKIF